VNLSNILNLRAAATSVINADGTTQQQLARIDGGSGTDYLVLSGGANLDFTAINNTDAGTPIGSSRITNIERIDMSQDSSSNNVTISFRDVVDMSGLNLFNTNNGWANLNGGTALSSSVARHQITIEGTSLDSVDLVDGNGTSAWTNAGSVNNNVGIIFNVWNHNSAAAQILIQQNVQVI
jgi:hypothetical protein